MKYKVSEYAKLKRVQYRTVWNWIKAGKVQTEKTETGRILILLDEHDINKEFNVAIYARVSSSENKGNLEKQKDRLLSYSNAKGYKVCKVVTEVASGLNDKRPKLEKLLKDSSLDIILVEHKDRLTRFGANYIETILQSVGRKVEYINPVETDKEDIIQDFVSIITSFCARIYGNRRSKRKTEQLIKELENDKIN